MSPIAGGQNISKAASVPLVIHNAMDISAQNGNEYPSIPVEQHSTLVLPFVMLLLTIADLSTLTIW